MLDNENGRPALNLAYADVLGAFHDFIGSRENDRPYIVASHSQGGESPKRKVRDLAVFSLFRSFAKLIFSAQAGI